MCTNKQTRIRIYNISQDYVSGLLYLVNVARCKLS